MKLKGISNKKVRKQDQKQKNNKNGIISLTTLNDKTKES